MELKSLIRDIPNFPKPGITYKDICPLLASPSGYKSSIDNFANHFNQIEFDAIAGIESRGFLFASALAYSLEKPLILIRKHGKLPHDTYKTSYELEYNSDSLEIQKDALSDGNKVILIDDVLATGGTAEAAMQLIQKTGAELVAMGFLIELDALSGRESLPEINIYSQIHYL